MTQMLGVKAFAGRRPRRTLSNILASPSLPYPSIPNPNIKLSKTRKKKKGPETSKAAKTCKDPLNTTEALQSTVSKFVQKLNPAQTC